MRQPLDDARLTRANKSITESYRSERIPPRSVAAFVYSWEDQGVKGDPRAIQIDMSSKLDRTTLERWVNALLDQPVIISITGDKTKLDERRLGTLAPVTYVPVEKLFGY